jgi:hypothetical protein
MGVLVCAGVAVLGSVLGACGSSSSSSSPTTAKPTRGFNAQRDVSASCALGGDSVVAWRLPSGNSYALTAWWAVGQASRLVPGVSDQRIKGIDSRSFKTPVGVDSTYVFHASVSLNGFPNAFSDVAECR